MPDSGTAAEPGLVAATLACRCPACGQGRLFDGVVSVRPACEACGMDFSGADTGDGFAVPSLILIGAVVVSAAFWVDTRFTPPLWVHAVLWPPITIGLVIVLTRYIKSFLVVQQYRTRRLEMDG